MSNHANAKWRLVLCIIAILAVGVPAWSAKAPTTQPVKTARPARQTRRAKRKVKPPTTRPARKPKPKATKPKAKPKPTKPAIKPQVKPKPTTKPAIPKPNIAHVAMTGRVLSSPPEFSLLGGQGQGTTLREWLQRLARIRNDEEIDAVALEMDSPAMSWAQAQELADAVRRLNEKKPVYAHIISGSAMQYIVASAARELTMDPAGELAITGLAAEMTFFRGTLNYVGIEPQLFQIGRYKGAAEPMTRTGPSREFKGEYDKIFDDLYNQLCGQIARQRGLTIPHVRYAVDNGPFSAKSAREYKLVNGLIERCDWEQHVVNAVIAKRDTKAMWFGNFGAKKQKKVDFGNPFALLGAIMGKQTDTSTKGPTVAIIHADGTIIDGRSG